MGDVLGQLVELLRGQLDSPWLWGIVFVVAGLDALLPFMPSETTVVMVAVLLGPDLPRLAALAAVAAAGALCGDCLGHAVGRWGGPRLIARLLRGERGRRRYAWACDAVARHGTLLVVAARFLPGGRVAAGLSTGGLRFPLRRFVLLDAAGAGLWAVTSTGIGAIGGAGFAEEPVKGVLLAFGLALAVVVAVEGARRVRAARPTSAR
ncbi:DedA family protein [Streptomyces sp. NPDC059788]|uniref:DedA family protein n=1 Tax=Streptomyces sp. NPDC059788 TaxID=3346948 RepID=UPI00365B181B